MANYSDNYVSLKHPGQLSLLLLLFQTYTRTRDSDSPPPRIVDRGEANATNISYAIIAADLFKHGTIGSSSCYVDNSMYQGAPARSLLVIQFNCGNRLNNRDGEGSLGKTKEQQN